MAQEPKDLVVTPPAPPASTQAQQYAGRETAEIQVMATMAFTRPRDEPAAFAKIFKSCTRPTFAEKARYAFPRGGSTISGPSVRFAREAARCWGNLRYGYNVVDMRADGTIVLEGYCHDLETNAKNSASLSFKRLIYRKDQGWIEPDERDFRELLAKQGAIASRNAILQVLPPDVVEDGMAVVQDTMKKAANGEIEQSMDQTLRRLAVAFADFAVTTDMLAEHLGHDYDVVSPDELTELRGVLAALREGAAKREEVFPSTKKTTKAKKALEDFTNDADGSSTSDAA